MVKTFFKFCVELDVKKLAFYTNFKLKVDISPYEFFQLLQILQILKNTQNVLFWYLNLFFRLEVSLFLILVNLVNLIYFC